MKAMVYYGNQDIRFENIPEPKLKQSELNKELSGKLADAEKENTVIRDKLAKSNLIADSIANPKVMEQKINELKEKFGELDAQQIIDLMKKEELLKKQVDQMKKQEEQAKKN